MKLTNSYGLPEAFMLAYMASEHEVPEKAISVTQLISPVQQFQLIQRHTDDICVDIMDNLFLLLGQAFHEYMATHGKGQIEQLLSTEIHGQQIVGKPDCIANGRIYDYKVTSAWSYIYGKEEWNQQLNVYRWLAVKNGIPVNDLRIIPIFRDWNERYTTSADYPMYPSVQIPIPLWDLAITEQYVSERIMAHQEAAAQPDNQLPPCTAAERWQKEGTWAVYKTNASKRAYRICNSEIEAQGLVSEFPNGRIDYRPGVATRCERYCNAAPYCKQWQDIQKEELEAGMQALASY